MHTVTLMFAFDNTPQPLRALPLGSLFVLHYQDGEAGAVVWQKAPGGCVCLNLVGEAVEHFPGDTLVRARVTG